MNLGAGGRRASVGGSGDRFGLTSPAPGRGRTNNTLSRVILPGARYYRTLYDMVVRSVRHRGLRRLIEDDNARFLRPELVRRVRNVLTLLILARDLDSFIADSPRGWRVHRLSGNRQKEWSVSVSGNWRITFEEEAGYVDGLNLEDYH